MQKMDANETVRLELEFDPKAHDQWVYLNRLEQCFILNAIAKKLKERFVSISTLTCRLQRFNKTYNGYNSTKINISVES